MVWGWWGCSMLSAMFSGRHALIKDAEGAHFIDRSPKWFDKVLLLAATILHMQSRSRKSNVDLGRK
jgi:hypothetical protein